MDFHCWKNSNEQSFNFKPKVPIEFEMSIVDASMPSTNPCSPCKLRIPNQFDDLETKTKFNNFNNLKPNANPKKEATFNKLDVTKLDAKPNCTFDKEKKPKQIVYT
jgi:hypothetical protein